jgi:uncharacterized membrane protein YphA (DoxX/SURF4 family)
MKLPALPTQLGNKKLTPIFLRLGLAIMFLYAAISSFVDPREWVGFLPVILTDRIDAETLLHIFSVYELAIAAWLLSGVYVRYAALLCAVTLAGIVVTNFELFAISFRDTGLMFAALALATYAED